MAVLLSDDFDRANSTTSLGSPVAGGPYTVSGGTWGINNGEAYLSTPSAGGQVTFPAAFNVEISYRLAVATSSQVSPGVMIRWIDATNFWFIGRGSNNGYFAIWRCAGGTFAQATPDAPAVLNDIIRVVAYGDQIALYVNGVQRGLVTDQWAASTTATTAGMRNGGTSTGRWDSLLVQDVTAPINYWGAAPEVALSPVAHADASIPQASSLYKGRDTALADESEIP